MAGKSDKFEYDVLRLIFNGVALPNLGTTSGTTSLWIGLHTADPGDAGSTANEGGYNEYTRVATDRSTAASGWAITSGTSNAVASASPVGTINFPQSVATTSTGTFGWFSVFPSSNAQGSSAIYSGTVAPVINFSQGVTPQVTTASSITED